MDCFKCSMAIEDEFLYRVEGSSLPVHRECMACEDCGVSLDNCYHKDNSYYCPKDFYIRFGPKSICGGCHEDIVFDADAVKMAENFYHVACVKCSDCQIPLGSGDQVGINEGLLKCKEHHKPATIDDSAEEENNNLKEEQTDSPKSIYNDEEVESDSEKKEDEDGKDSKRRGPRTTIKAKQLEVLKTVFSQTPKPTRLMREQLAKETGLPMRVIQVWFQNKRSKEKRLHQMRFMARAPFLPPNARRFPPHHGDPRFCFPPNGMPPFGDYGGPPGPGFDPSCGGGFPGPMPPFGGPNFDGHPPPPHMTDINFPPHQSLPPNPPPQMGNLPMSINNNNAGQGGEESPLDSFPSPPPQNQDFHTPPPNSEFPSSSLSMTPSGQTEQCFPSPPLSLELPNGGNMNNNSSSVSSATNNTTTVSS